MEIYHWIKMSEAKPKPFPCPKLWMDGTPDCLLAAEILAGINYKFNVNFLRADQQDDDWRLPELWVRSSKYIGSKEIKTLARRLALDLTDSDDPPYFPKAIFSEDLWYHNEQGSYQPWVRELSPNGTVLSKNKLENARLPVKEMLQDHWYTKRQGRWDKILVWDVGLWEKLLTQATPAKNLIIPEPPVVLFKDELAKLKQKGQIITYDYGCADGVFFDAYFLKNGHLLRIYAEETD